MKILVADDEPAIREIAEELLAAAGYTVLLAEDGEQALRLIHAELPDLILLDLMLPKMTGFHVLQEVRKTPRVSKIPILILSVLVSGEDTDASIHELDVTGFIDKSEFVTSLVSRVQEILSGQAHRVA